MRRRWHFVLSCALAALAVPACIDLAPIEDDPPVDASDDGSAGAAGNPSGGATGDASDGAAGDASGGAAGDASLDAPVDAAGDASLDAPADAADAAGDADADAGCTTQSLKTPTVLATNQGGPFSVLADGQDLWWSDEGGGVVHASLDGTGATAVPLPAGVKGVTSLRVDATHLYMSAYYSDAILRAPRTGGAATVWAASQNGIGLALDADYVYWPDEISSSIRRAAKSASVPVSAQWFAAGQTKAHFIAVDPTHVFWSVKAGGVMRKAKSGGNVETVATVALGMEVWDVAVDGDASGFVFWREGNASTGRVMRAKKDGSAPTVLADFEPGPRLISLDGTHLYWTSNVTMSVLRVPVLGGCKELLVTGQPGAHGIAVNATHLFWTSWTAGTVSRAVK